MKKNERLIKIPSLDLLSEKLTESQRIHDLEIALQLHTSQIQLLSSSIKDLSLSAANGFTKLFSELKKIHRSLHLINMKVQALASVVVERTDVEADQIEAKLEQIKMATMDVKAEIEKLIEDTTPDVEN